MPLNNMDQKLTFFLYIIYSGAIVQIVGQNCRPTNVENLVLDENSTLSWTPSPNENCTISSYLVYIHAGVNTEYVHMVEDPIVDVSYLPICESYRFTVVAVSSDAIEGPDRLLFARMPLPAGPLTVQSIAIDDNSTLTWSPDPNENCTIDYYLVQIHNGLTVDYIYRVEETSLIVDFLPVCESYRFLISPVSTDSISGIERVFFTRLPLPVDANLTVGLVMVSEHEETVYLRWVMDAEWEQCAERFRVIIFDEDDDTIVDKFTRESSVNITHLRPCTSYTFGVVALYNVIIEGPVTTVSRKIGEARISPPTVASIQLRPTAVDITWRLEEFTMNRCAVTSLEITSSTFNISQEIVDQTVRLPVPTNLTNLQPDTIYVLNVTVINVAGPSIPTIIAIQTPAN